MGTEPTINQSNGQKFVMLIVRGNVNHSNNDSIYIIKPKQNNSISPHSQNDIIPGLSSTADGVLGFTHHLHSAVSNKVFLSYGPFKEMVTKSTMVEKLQNVSDYTLGSD